MIRRSLRGLAADERGFVAVLVMSVMLIGVVISSAVVLQSTTTETQVRRDTSSKRAVEAARAGAEAARLLAFSSAASWATSGNTCPTSSGGTPGTPVAADATGWCAAVTQKIGAGASYTYRLGPIVSADGTLTRQVVVTGCVTNGQGSVASSAATCLQQDAVRRRLRRALSRVSVSTTYDPFTKYGVIGWNRVTVNSSGVIGTSTDPIDVGSNGDIWVDGTICGSATPGPGKSGPVGNNWNKGTNASCLHPNSGITQTALPPVVVPTTDDDYAAFGATHNQNSGSWTGTWDLSTKSLNVNTGTLTVTGNTFVFCNLNLNGKLQINATDPNTAVRIYMGGTGCSSPNISLNSGSNLSSNLSISNRTDLLPQLYFAGSNDINVNSNTWYVFGVIYAPNSKVQINGGGTYQGDVAAREVQVDGQIQKNPYPNDTITVGTSTTTYAYRPGQLVECVSSTSASQSTNPQDGC